MTKFAVICASNQNRSMEAHHVLSKKGFNIDSYGTGSAVRLPGPSADKPNIYNFETPYDQIYKELSKQDHNLYVRNGLLSMLDRNRKIKNAPQRFQDYNKTYDVIFSCEERCFDAILEELSRRGGIHNKAVHVINFDIPDNHEDAALGARSILQLATIINESLDLDNEITPILNDFQDKTAFSVLYSCSFY